ncbi:MAG: PAS domain S-box protein [Magnetococcales bacterium]|nr:PAS domain S-box protein [Magnetococcales bacterium]
MEINARRAAMGLVVFVVGVIGVGGLVLDRMQRLSGLTEQIHHHPFAVSNAVLRVREQAAAMRLGVMESLQEQEMDWERLSTRLEGQEQKAREDWHQVQERYLGDPAQVRAFGEALTGWIALNRDILVARRDRGVETALQVMRLETDRRFQRMVETSDTILFFANNKAIELRQQADQQLRWVTWVGLGLIAGLFGIGGWLAWRMSGRLRIAEQARRHSQNAFQEQATMLENLVFTASDLAIVATDEALVVRIFNPAAERLFHLRVDEVVGRRVWDLHDRLGVSREQLEAGLTRVGRVGHEQFESHDPLAHGGRILEVRVSLILDRERRPVGHLLLARDVTEARRAAERLTRSEEKFRLLMESARDAIIVADADTGLILDANRQAETLLKMPMAEIVGMHQSRLHPPEDRARYQETFRSQVESGGGFVANVQVVNRIGERIPVEINAGVIRLGGRRVIQGIFRDVTERHHAEQALRWAMESLTASQSRLQGILDHSRTVITLKDPRGRYLLINRRFEELFGVREAACLGRMDEDLFPVEMAERARVSDAQALGEGPCEVEENWIHPDGVRTYIVVKFPLIDPRGLTTAVCAIATEITERKRMEEELRQLNVFLEKRVAERTLELERSNRDLQQFAHVASHDLQEPLRQVSGFAQLLSRRYRGQLDEKADQFIDYMVDGTRHMQELIEALLSFSRVNTHGAPLTLISVERVVDQVLRNLATSITQSGAVITREPLPELLGDSFLLVRMFQNLIANALKFHGEEAPRVHIGVEALESFWRFSVRDNGIGIEERHQERIFVIFQRLHTRSTHPGTGIGLAICKRIAERHGGEVWVESEVGKGSTFYFTMAR